MLLFVMAVIAVTVGTVAVWGLQYEDVPVRFRVFCVSGLQPLSVIPCRHFGVGVRFGGVARYGGLIHVLAAKPTDTVFVSAAAGAVGSLVGQIAKKVTPFPIPTPLPVGLLYFGTRYL